MLGGISATRGVPLGASRCERRLRRRRTAETSHDPFFPLLLAAQATERLEARTGVAITFARTPMTLAVVANDLQARRSGRFILGLGSQIKPHIERRFSMPWSHPAAAHAASSCSRCAAIWSTWNDGAQLRSTASSTAHVDDAVLRSRAERVRAAAG